MATEQMGLTDLLKHGLEDMYYAESRIHKALPKMIAAAQDPELKSGLQKHLEETAEQISILEEAFELMGKKPQSEKCDAMDGILKEGDSLLQEFGGTAAGDAAIIFSCQAAEHYEIARYGSLRAYAELLGMDQVADLMSDILDQEEAADELLSEIAESRANPMAAGTSGGSMGMAGDTGMGSDRL